MAVELKPTYQVKQIGPTKPKLNLFAFETKPTTRQVVNQSTQKATPGIPQTSANEGNVIQLFLDDSKTRPELQNKRKAVIEMLQNQEDDSFIEDAIVNQMKWSPMKQEQSFLGGVGEKTKESFVGGIKRIGEAGVGLAEGKYTVGEAAVRGGAGALQTAFSPIAGVLGQSLQSGIEAIPEDIRTKIKTEATPTIEGVTQWYNKQSPEQRRRLDNIGVGVELLANFVGAGAITKATPTIKQAGKAVVETVESGTKNIVEAIPSPTGVVTRDLPKAVVKRDLGFTPTEREKIQAIAGKTEEDIILEKGLAGKSKEESAAFFDKNSNEVYNNVNKQLATTNVTTKSTEAKEALEDMLDQLTSSKKLEKAYSDDIEVIKGLLAKEDYTGLELNNIRRAFDKVNTGMYTAKGLPKSGIENAIDVRIRQKLNDQIEAIAEQAGFSVKEMNQELRQSLLMKDALLRRLSQEQKNNFLGLQDIGVAGILTGGEPLSAALVIGAKKGAESLAPKFAQKLYNLNKAKNVPRTNVSRGVNITPSDSTNGGRLIKSSPSVSATMVDGTKKTPKLTIGQPRQVAKETPKVIKKPSILSEKEKAKLLEGKKKPSILAKEKVKQAVSKLTKDNVNEVAETIAKNYPGKLEQIKKVITDFIKEFGEDFKNYLGILADDIADVVGGRTKLFGGEKAKLFDKSRWQQAREMTKAGKSADDIWKETGWEKGADGKWKFEIDDSKAKLSITQKHFNEDFGEKGIVKLGDILEHESFYKQYPEAKNIKVELNKDINSKGSYSDFDGGLIQLDLSSKGNLISQKQSQIKGLQNFLKGADEDINELIKSGISKTEAKQIVVGDTLKDIKKIEREIQDLIKKDNISNSDIKSTLLHEIQHYIQEKEGFARGGSIGSFASKAGLQDDIQRIKDKIKDIDKNIEQADDMGYPDTYKFSGKTVKEIKEEKKKLLLDLKDAVKKSDNYIDPYEGYKSLGGETEARNVQTRLLNKDNKIRRPELTEDVPRSKQIIRKEGSTAMSIDKTKIISKGDDLIKEARKYKSADEFIKGLEDKGDIVYHGTLSDFDKFDLNKAKTGAGVNWLGDGVYLSTDKKVAEYWAKEAFNKNAKGKQTIKKVFIDKNSKILDGGLALEKRKDRSIIGEKFLQEEVKRGGYDGVSYGKEIVIVNPKKLKTEKELIYLFNKSLNKE